VLERKLIVVAILYYCPELFAGFPLFFLVFGALSITVGASESCAQMDYLT
jgi:hypothetical protein